MQHVKTVNFMPLSEVFHDIQNEVDYDPFVDSDMTWGNAAHTLYPVSRLQDVLTDMMTVPGYRLIYRKMLDRLKDFSPETLVDMEN